jgi:PAS domain S-box-containing protein
MDVKDLEHAIVLIIDDNLDVLEPLREYLALQGCTVYAIDDGQQAVDTTLQYHPDIVLLDVMMPRPDGFEVCRRLKAHDGTRHIPVMFMSGLSETVDKVTGFELGGVDYLTKPFQYQEAAVRLAAHISINRLQQRLQENNVHLQQEIEQRQQAEAALRENEERFRTIFEHAPVMINAYDERRGYILWNNECERRLGYTKDEIMAHRAPLTLLFPEHAQRMQIMIDLAEADGVFREYTISDKDGRQRVQLWATFRLPAGDVISVGHDITERKAAEDALLESQQYARNIIESSLNMIITVDQERRIVEFNRAAEAVFGYQRAEVIGKNVSMLYADSVEASNIGQTMVAETQSIREVYNRRKNGEVFPCLLSASTLRDFRGDVIGYMGISRDITELKQAQTEVLNAHNELKEKNAQLAELNASKDKFFSIIAHDLRGSFGTLLGFTQLVTENIDGYSKERIRTFVGRVRSSAERLYALLENLLTWSRIQRGIMQGAPRDIDLYALVRENMALVTDKSEQKRITLQNSVPEDCRVHADLSMVDTVLRNLLSNALKFTPEDGRIDVSVHQHTEQMIAVSVSDTGVGIPKEYLPQLLRIDTPYKTPGTDGEQGSGLGLILCKELIEHNRGELWVTSEEGMGTTFTFTLMQSPQASAE